MQNHIPTPMAASARTPTAAAIPAMAPVLRPLEPVVAVTVTGAAVGRLEVGASELPPSPPLREYPPSVGLADLEVMTEVGSWAACRMVDVRTPPGQAAVAYIGEVIHELVLPSAT